LLPAVTAVPGPAGLTANVSLVPLRMRKSDVDVGDSDR
jgi:hypothetical protein